METQFTGQVITNAVENEYELIIMVIRIQGGLGFLMSNLRGHFRFGVSHYPTTHMQRAVKQIMYGGDRVSRTSGLKKALLAHKSTLRWSHPLMANFNGEELRQDSIELTVLESPYLRFSVLIHSLIINELCVISRGSSWSCHRSRSSQSCIFYSCISMFPRLESLSTSQQLYWAYCQQRISKT